MGCTEEGLTDNDLNGLASDAHFERAAPIFSKEELLKDEAQTLLFFCSQLTSLGATLLLLNVCRTHDTINLFFSNLFTILSCNILSAMNNLPMLALKRLKQLGLDYEAIHACPNNYMLLRGQKNSTLEACSECNAPWFKRLGDSKVPMKVLKYFLLKPRLQRMFATPLQASFQTWYMANKSVDGLVRLAADSLQWQEIDKIDPQFIAEHRNLCLGLASDGVNHFSIT